MRIFWGIWSGDQTIEGVLDRNTGERWGSARSSPAVHIRCVLQTCGGAY
jgi:hypothetical protein